MTATRPWIAPRLSTDRPTVAVITPRQADVLCGLCHGHTNMEIARRLHITEHTVKSHVKSLLRELSARDRGHAAALAVSGAVTITVRVP